MSRRVFFFALSINITLAEMQGKIAYIRLKVIVSFLELYANRSCIGLPFIVDKYKQELVFDMVGHRNEEIDGMRTSLV
jgi:hypothetical protein